jgi:hypothetical protein
MNTLPTQLPHLMILFLQNLVTLEKKAPFQMETGKQIIVHQSFRLFIHYRICREYLLNTFTALRSSMNTRTLQKMRVAYVYVYVPFKKQGTHMIRVPFPGQPMAELLLYRLAIITANKATSSFYHISVAYLAPKFVI